MGGAIDTCHVCSATNPQCGCDCCGQPVCDDCSGTTRGDLCVCDSCERDAR